MFFCLFSARNFQLCGFYRRFSHFSRIENYHLRPCVILEKNLESIVPQWVEAVENFVEAVDNSL